MLTRRSYALQCLDYFTHFRLEQNICLISEQVPLIVGSVGPYGAHLHDGSEYDGSYADTTTVQVFFTLGLLYRIKLFFRFALMKHET